jgi:NodT family efflux transporter outer membrane factor (OMF) lipoprotein
MRQPTISGLDDEPQPVLSQAVEAAHLPEGYWPANWWELYGDPQLTEFIETAIAESPDLKRAYGVVLQAWAARGTERTNLFPNTSLGTRIHRVEYSLNGPFGAALNPMSIPGATGSGSGTFFPHIYWDYDLTANLQWTLDIWGRYRQLVAQAEGQVVAAEAEMEYARVTLGVNVAKAYFQLQTAMRRLNVNERLLQAQRQLLYVIQQRLERGLDTGLTLDLQVQSLTAQETTLLDIQLEVEQARHRLAMLMGGHWEVEVKPTNINYHLPIPDDLPAEWLGHRLDLVAARANVISAAHGIKAAKLEYLPNINLNSVWGLETITLHKWIQGHSFHADYGPAITLPLFTFGRIKWDIRGQEANYEVAVQTYNSTLIQAVQQVLDALSRIRLTADALASSSRQLKAYSDTYQLTQQRVTHGLDTDVSLLQAATAWLTQENQYLIVLDQQLQAQVDLVNAIGGGSAPYPVQ